MSTISLRKESYKNIKKNNEAKSIEKDNLFEVVDEIVNYLLKEKSTLIVEIEKGNIKKRELDEIISRYIKNNNLSVKEADDYEKIIESVNDYLYGYAFVNKFIEDESVSDISIKGLEDTWIKRNGEREITDIKFPSIKSIMNFAYSIAIKNGGNLSRRDAVAVLGDSKTSPNFNLRINIGIQPVNSVSPHIVIRKIPKWRIKPDMKELQRRGMFNEEIRAYIENVFRKGLNILIVGQGASGKSTILNAGIECIPEYLSKLAIQEVEELSSGKKNWIWQNVIKKTAEGDIEYDLQKLATNGLLLDIDWYIIGESKGAESMSLFDACYTGHKVGLTAHAPSSIEGIEKVVLNMKKSGTDYKREDLLKMMSNLDVVIFMKKYKVAEITEISGWDEEKKELMLHPVYKFNIDREEEFRLKGNFQKINNSCEKVSKKLKAVKVGGE